ncbi:MAG: PilZ domain-containing protein [Myxococcota bacterium]
MGTRIRTVIDTEFEAGSVHGKGKIRNVAEGGAFVGTSQVPDQGDLVVLSFRDGRGGRLDVSGLVWWTTSEAPGAHTRPGFGVRLLDDDPDYERFVESLR